MYYSSLDSVGEIAQHAPRHICVLDEDDSLVAHLRKDYSEGFSSVSGRRSAVSLVSVVHCQCPFNYCFDPEKMRLPTSSPNLAGRNKSETAKIAVRAHFNVLWTNLAIAGNLLLMIFILADADL